LEPHQVAELGRRAEFGFGAVRSGRKGCERAGAHRAARRASCLGREALSDSHHGPGRVSARTQFPPHTLPQKAVPNLGPSMSGLLVPMTRANILTALALALLAAPAGAQQTRLDPPAAVEMIRTLQQRVAGLEARVIQLENELGRLREAQRQAEIEAANRARMRDIETGGRERAR
jgi:hypothetical protein